MGPLSPAPAVTLVVGGQNVSGFSDISITRSCEALPNTFDVALSITSLAPAPGVVCGAPCSILIGGELVLTGYIEEDGNDADPLSHVLPVSGSGKACDLVECSVKGPAGGFVSGQSVLSLAQLLAADYGITVAAAAGANVGQVIPGFAIQYGDTPAQILDHICQAAQLLCYEQPDGSLLLSQVGSTRAASGIVYGKNAQRWSVRNSMAERYSQVLVEQLSLDTLKAIGGDLAPAATASDGGVPRFRLLYSRGEGLDLTHCKMKALWEVNRRAGRGTVLRATVDSWFDTAGALWTPNTLLTCAGPGLRAGGADGAPVDLCISSVTYSYTEGGGTTASIVAMPPYGFSPEPIMLQPQLRSINANDGTGLEPLQ